MEIVDTCAIVGLVLLASGFLWQYFRIKKLQRQLHILNLRRR